MRKSLVRLLLVMAMGMAPLWAGHAQAGERGSQPSPEDLQVIAVIEILNMLDLATNLEMVEDMEYLVEEDHDEPIKKD